MAAVGLFQAYRSFLYILGSEKMVDIIKAIKEEFPDNALTLSIGERSYESYKKLYEAGADRFLLRHESATKSLYESIHTVYKIIASVKTKSHWLV